MNAIDVENLSYTYSDGIKALDDVTFSLCKGESVALLGPNGAGKSTLLLHLNGLLKGQGIVRVFGKAIEDANLTSIRRQVGMVFQDPDDQLFMPTLFEDAAFGPKNMGLDENEVQRRVEFALSSVGLLDLSKRTPHHLSFGQRKRAALATVLSMEPKVLVLDEPTSNLDPRSKMEMVSLIRKLQEGGTTIFTATHDVNIVPLLADRVILLKYKVVDIGDTREILQNGELLGELGLEVPIIADMFKTLADMNIYFGDIPFTKEEALKAIAELKK